ncbi:MAG: 50S ribosomal protein L32 [Ignavibacteria bacterium]|nr:50S ribosomal protein L32 [Ignavibacteria bacterium]
MPNPKRRHSKARGRKRRTHYKAAMPSLVACSNCGEMKMTHKVCPACGFYYKKSVIIPKKSKK